MATEQQRLEEELSLLKERQQLKAEKAVETTDLSATDLAQSFNTGLVDLINLPSDLLNIPLGLAGLPEIPTGQFRETVAGAGLTAQPGEEAPGFLSRGARILGGSVLPAAGIQKFGAEVIKRGIPTAQQTVAQRLGTLTAQSPAASAAIDVSSSFGAGLGGEVAANLTDDPTLVLLGELAGGFTFPAVTAASRFATGPIKSKIRETLTPFTQAGAEPRASARLQSLSADPRAEAARIDVESPVTPARQTENPRLLALEKTVLDQNPELDAKLTEQLSGAVDEARRAATDFGGTDRVRSLLTRGKDYLVDLVNLRAAKAGQAAQDDIARLTAVTPRDASRIARVELDKALTEVRVTENELWGAIDKKAPGAFTNAKAALDTVLAEASALVPTKIPKWLNKAIGTVEGVTLNDLQQVRSAALKEARRATSQGKFDKARTLNLAADGVLADMGAVNAEGIEAALAFSRQLNERFTQGVVSEVLSKGANRGAGVAAADTLNRVFSGGKPATNIRAFLSASPESGPQVQNFLRSRFATRSAPNGQFNQKASATEVARLRDQGVFEIFPELESELLKTGQLFQDTERLVRRAATVAERGGARIAQDSRQSLAGALLGSDPGQEMSTLLRAENPIRLARTLLRRMGGNTDAQQGLKSSFVEAVFKGATAASAAGELELSGKALTKIFNENLRVAKALGMSPADIRRTRSSIKQIVQAQAAPGQSVGGILDDKPARLLNFVARVAGAKFGQKIAGGGIGSSLVIAGEGSTQARNILQDLTVSAAQKLIIAAQSDPKLFKALLLRTDAPKEQIFNASRIIESWKIGAATTAVQEQRQ